MLLLFLCFMREENEDEELALVWYMECVQPLDKVDDALRCVCL